MTSVLTRQCRTLGGLYLEAFSRRYDQKFMLEKLIPTIIGLQLVGILSTAELRCQSLPKSSASGEQAERSLQVDALLAPLLKGNAPGFAVLVMKEGKVLHNKGYGLANLKTLEPITAETVFDLASISKQFTAMGIMILKEKGSLSYDDPLSKFYPEFLTYAEGVTIRHLLNHTSGLPEYLDLLAPPSEKVKSDLLTFETVGEQEHTSKEVRDLLARQKTLRFPPGEVWEYCNSGYVILAQIIEKVSNQSFPQFMKVNIFDRLGMSHTLVYNEVRPKIPNRAISYAFQGTTYKNMDYSPLNLIYGDGNVNTTTADMAKWYQALEENRLVKVTTLDQALTSGQVNSGATTGYGYGWYVATSFGLKRASHSGTWAGFRNFVIHYPVEHFTALVLSNSAEFSRFDRSAIASKIAEIYLAEKLKHPVPVNLDLATLRRYAGKYETETGEVLSITFERNSLWVASAQETRTKLVPVSELKFIVKDAEDEVVFQADEKQKVTGLILRLSLRGYTNQAYLRARKTL
jgi:CubicO group peptidase (beta-lactamase class C family)